MTPKPLLSHSIASHCVKSSSDNIVPYIPDSQLVVATLNALGISACWNMIWTDKFPFSHQTSIEHLPVFAEADVRVDARLNATHVVCYQRLTISVID